MGDPACSTAQGKQHKRRARWQAQAALNGNQRVVQAGVQTGVAQDVRQQSLARRVRWQRNKPRLT